MASDSFVYVTGVTLDEIHDARHHETDAHDPLAFFSFSTSITRNYQTTRYDDAARIVFAEKGGADASHYIKRLEDRLHEAGLTDARVVARLAEPGGTTIGFYFAGLSKDEANAVRSRLNEMAADLGYRAERGPTAGGGNAAALMVAIARGDIILRPRSEKANN